MGIARKTGNPEEGKAPLAAAPDEVSAERASYRIIGPESEGQRLDNYLIRIAKGVPKSHVYRIVRQGEVRVNKGTLVEIW